MHRPLGLPTISISLGDPAGVGPEVTVKALADPAVRALARWIIVGDSWLVDEAGGQCGPIEYQLVDDLEDANIDAGCVVLNTRSIQPRDRPVGRVSQECGRAGLGYVRLATEQCLAGKADAIVTAPLNKEAVALTGEQFTGHTEYIAELCGATESRMLLVNDRLCVVHVSTHVSLIEAANLSEERILKTIELADSAYVCLRGRRPRIAVCGLNPHAGENGLFGNAETRFIEPAVRKAQALGIDCRGPLPADTLFLQAFGGSCDVVTAMYHDQGHIPMKLMDFDHTVNVTLGLPIVRTSVDHGTAFDIAGKNLAGADDMKCAMEMAVRLVRGRLGSLAEASLSS